MSIFKFLILSFCFLIIPLRLVCSQELLNSLDNSTNQLEIINNQDDELQQFNQDEGYGDDEEYYGAEGRGEQGNIYSESSV